MNFRLFSLLLLSLALAGPPPVYAQKRGKKAPVPANALNIATANRWLEPIEGNGGTDIQSTSPKSVAAKSVADRLMLGTS